MLEGREGTRAVKVGRGEERTPVKIFLTVVTPVKSFTNRSNTC